jgi:hypothetical protein
MAAVQGWVASIMFGLCIAYVSVGLDSFRAEAQSGGLPFYVDDDGVATIGNQSSHGSASLLLPRFSNKPPHGIP